MMGVEFKSRAVVLGYESAPKIHATGSVHCGEHVGKSASPNLLFLHILVVNYKLPMANS